MTFGEKLKAIRKEKGYSQEEMAGLLNEMWVHSPPLGAQGNFKRKEKHDTM